MIAADVCEMPAGWLASSIRPTGRTGAGRAIYYVVSGAEVGGQACGEVSGSVRQRQAASVRSMTGVSFR